MKKRTLHAQLAEQRREFRERGGPGYVSFSVKARPARYLVVTFHISVGGEVRLTGTCPGGQLTPTDHAGRKEAFRHYRQLCRDLFVRPRRRRQ